MRLPDIQWSRTLPAVLAGALLAMAYPGINLEAGLWLGLLPLLWVLWKGNNGNPLEPGSAFRIGWLTGFTFFFITLRWLSYIHNGGVIGSLAAWILLSIYLGLFVGLWSVFAVTIGCLKESLLSPINKKPWWQIAAAHSLSRAFLCAIAWVAIEWTRSWTLAGFRWNTLGSGLHDNITLMQAADLVGVTGLSFLPVFCACVMFATIRRLTLQLKHGRRLASNYDFLLACFLVLLCFLYGVNRLSSAPLPAADGSNTLEIMIVQQNIPQDEKWEEQLAEKHALGYYKAIVNGVRDVRNAEAERIATNLQADAESSGIEFQATVYSPDMVILPESALPFQLWWSSTREFAEAVMNELPTTTLITGINDTSLGKDPEEFYNVIAVFPQGSTTPESFRKVKLVPFGEFLPMRWFPGMELLLGNIVPGDFTPGTSTNPLVIPHHGKEIDIIPLICFEDTLGEHVRKFIRKGNPQIMVNATNNGWFPDPAGGLQHAANARFRAVELRRPLIRAANTGLSCVFDSRGRTIWTETNNSTATFKQEIRDPITGSTQIQDVLHARVLLEPNAEITVYARFGDWFANSATLITILVTAVYFSRARHPRRNPLTPATQI